MEKEKTCNDLAPIIERLRSAASTIFDTM